MILQRVKIVLLHLNLSWVWLPSESPRWCLCVHALSCLFATVGAILGKTSSLRGSSRLAFERTLSLVERSIKSSQMIPIISLWMLKIVKAILLRLLRLYHFQMRVQHFNERSKIQFHLLQLMTGIRCLTIVQSFTGLSHLKQKVIDDFNSTFELLLARFNRDHLNL